VTGSDADADAGAGVDVAVGRGEQTGPRLGVLDFHPIQNHVPLYRLLAHRRVVDLSVLYLRDWGSRGYLDPGFGVPVSWEDVAPLSGYRHDFLTTGGRPAARSGRVAALTRWIRSQHAVVIHGYSEPWMLLAAAICRACRVRYLLRCDAGPDAASAGVRRRARDLVARAVVSGSAGGLAVGRLNEEFYRKYRAPLVRFAPHSVDNDRFAAAPPVARSELLARWALDPEPPVIMFCGKLHERKRPLDLLAAAARLPGPVTILFVGDGALAPRIRASLRARGTGAVTGFVTQSQLPCYYHAADVLALPSEHEPWGLVVNEAMAAGVLPVVSDRVGAAPDLVAGVGEVFGCGDVAGLAAALARALARLAEPRARARLRERARERVDGFGLDRTAAGFEQAALTVAARPVNARRSAGHVARAPAPDVARGPAGHVARPSALNVTSRSAGNLAGRPRDVPSAGPAARNLQQQRRGHDH
jgi:glycosyltransferase involved in cell wall biosynthesis